jgi:bifunctional UDP-N-acetylglucosamine pyrophosphorylase/glucosamine-1-phosphate N-acetyltransferase
MSKSPGQARKLRAVVMAAGQGTRMMSRTPKVLHPLLGRPMIGWVLATAQAVGCEAAEVIVGHGREAVEAYVREAFPTADDDPNARSNSLRVGFAHQAGQRGTAHAVQQALPALRGFEGRVLILNGDLPCAPTDALQHLLALDDAEPKALSIVSAHVTDPRGFGRVVRSPDGTPAAIVEDKDCSPQQRLITEVNAGIYLCDAAFLAAHLGTIRDQNAQGERYLTDLLAIAAAQGSARAYAAPDPTPLLGVNDRVQLAIAQRWLQQQVNTAWMRRGVTFLLPDSTLIEYAVTLAPDVTIGPGAHLRGQTRVGEGAFIGAHAVLEDASIPAGATVAPGAHIRGAALA